LLIFWQLHTKYSILEVVNILILPCRLAAQEQPSIIIRESKGYEKKTEGEHSPWLEIPMLVNFHDSNNFQITNLLAI
jgi:hypothetical protein